MMDLDEENRNETAFASSEDPTKLLVPTEIIQKAAKQCEDLHANMSEPSFETGRKSSF